MWRRCDTLGYESHACHSCLNAGVAQGLRYTSKHHTTVTGGTAGLSDSTFRTLDRGTKRETAAASRTNKLPFALQNHLANARRLIRGVHSWRLPASIRALSTVIRNAAVYRYSHVRSPPVSASPIGLAALLLVLPGHYV